MIRPITCICVLLAGGSGLYLYQTKHRTRLLDRQIEQTMKQVEVARARTGMLEAEWALLNQPERLADLADRFLPLKPVAPAQFVPLADLDQRLPPPLPPPAAGDASGTDEGADAGGAPTAAAAAASVPVAVAEPPSAAAPSPPPTKSAPLPGVKPPEPPASARHAPARHEPAQAEHRPAPARHNANPAEARMPTTVASARGAAVAAPHPRPTHPPGATAAVEPAPPIARPATANAPVVGSVLGAAHVAMAPPVPVSAAAWSAAR